MYGRSDSGGEREHTYNSKPGTSSKVVHAAELESQESCQTFLTETRGSNAAISLVWNGRLEVCAPCTRTSARRVGSIMCCLNMAIYSFSEQKYLQHKKYVSQAPHDMWHSLACAASLKGVYPIVIGGIDLCMRT